MELVRQVYEAVCPDYDDEVVRQGALLPPLLLQLSPSFPPSVLLLKPDHPLIQVPHTLHRAVPIEVTEKRHQHRCLRQSSLSWSFLMRESVRALRSAMVQCGDAGYQAMSGPFPAPKKGRPVFIALIDTAAGSDFLELVKLALAATLDALPANALVGIITVSDCVRARARTAASDNGLVFVCSQYRSSPA